MRRRDAVSRRMSLSRRRLKRRFSPLNPKLNCFDKFRLGLPEAMWQRYHELIEKRRDEVIETAELDELIEITDAIEAANARRMRALVDLSKLRGTTLDAVMFELGITPPQDE